MHLKAVGVIKFLCSCSEMIAASHVLTYLSEKLRDGHANTSVPRVHASHCQKFLCTVNKCDLYLTKVNILNR
jgi:hypothetical protein